MKFKISGNRVETYIQLVLREIFLDIDNLIEGLIIDVLKYKDSGLNDREALEAVRSEISSEQGRYKAFRNRMKRQIKEHIKVAIAKPAIEASNDEPDLKFRWILGDVKTKHCPDCLALSREKARTIDEWRMFGKGLPREGLTACSVGCRCALRPSQV